MKTYAVSKQYTYIFNKRKASKNHACFACKIACYEKEKINILIHVYNILWIFFFIEWVHNFGM